MANRNWTNAFLDALRLQGDPEVDALAEYVLDRKDAGQTGGRTGYNFMLDLADQLRANPSLTLVPDSTLSRALENVPDPLRAYFRPMPAPEWVDEEKLRLGAALWQENMLAMLGVLYASSLPSCYLIANGIPSLYQTEKLLQQRYIFQRIYETGLMLDAVMSEGGLHVVHDFQDDIDTRLERTLQAMDPDGHWSRDRDGLRRRSAAEPVSLDVACIQAKLEESPPAVHRYLWGAGYLTAKKVRFLHASMRFMLTQPDRQAPFGDADRPATLTEQMSHRQEPWDTARLGAPINQEDLAYTLLTFAYLLPRGLAKWGCRIDMGQREAFLHLWKVIGHVMGIRDELLTDDWHEAGELYAIIRQRQARSSPEGMQLTEALIGFLGEYLPRNFDLAEQIAVLMMIDQIGAAAAAKVLAPALVAEARKPGRRFAYAVGRLGVRVYYSVRTLVLRRMPTLATLFSNLLDRASEQLIASWRDAYARRPFWVPYDATTWKREVGATKQFLGRLRAWRRELFNTLFIAILWLFVAAFSFVVGLVGAVLGLHVILKASAVACIVSMITALVIMQWRLPAVFGRRPEIKGEGWVEPSLAGEDLCLLQTFSGTASAVHPRWWWHLLPPNPVRFSWRRRSSG